MSVLSVAISFMRSVRSFMGLYFKDSYPLEPDVRSRIDGSRDRMKVVLDRADTKSNDTKTKERIFSFYNLYISSGCKNAEDFARYYIEHEIFPKYAKVYRDDIVNELLTPTDFVNHSKYVGVKTLTDGWRLGYLDDGKISADDYIRFNMIHPKDNIKDFVQVYVPGLGYNFYRRTSVNNKRVFVLNGGKRYNIISVLARDDESLIRKYIDVFKRIPIEAEYILFLYTKNKDAEGTKQWFDHDVYCFENPVEEE